MIEVIRWAWGLLGIAFFASAALLYQDEELRLRNKLVDWWVTTTQVGEASVARHVALTRGLASATLKVITFCFGEKSFSLQALWASLMLSSASFCLWVALYDHGLGDYIPTPLLSGLDSSDFIKQAFWAFAFALIPAVYRRKRSRWQRIAMWILMVLWSITSVVDWAKNGFMHQWRGSSAWHRDLLLAYALSVLYDLGLVAFLRRVLHLASTGTRFSIVVILTLALMPVVIFGVPECIELGLTRGMGLNYRGARLMMDTWGDTGWLIIGGMLFSIPLNGFWVLISVGLVGTAILLLCNGLVWMLATRVLHALHARFPGRGYLVAAGAFCWLAFATSFSGALKHAIGAPTEPSPSASVPDREAAHARAVPSSAP